jgi:hypothetical protein
MPIVSKAVDYENVPGTKQTNGVVQKRRVRARDSERHRSSGDTVAAKHRPNASIAEAP